MVGSTEVVDELEEESAAKTVIEQIARMANKANKSEFRNMFVERIMVWQVGNLVI